jgi:acetyl-CoA acetyltransferase
MLPLLEQQTSYFWTGGAEGQLLIARCERCYRYQQLPMNTSGGQLSAGRFHGYGHTYEACQQLWGLGGERQVQGARVCAVASGGYGYGALLLRAES